MILNILNFLAIAPCFIGKLPQIILIVKTQNVRGVSFGSLLLDLFCYVNTGAFSFFQEYPILQYLEYPLLLIQNTILLSLHGQISRRRLKSLVWLCLFCVQFYCISILPTNIVLTLIGSNIIIGSISKLMQIIAIVKSGTSGNVSAAAYFFNFLASTCRLWSMYLTGIGETMIQLSFLASIVGNAAVIMTIFLYRGTNQKKD
eukprot:TRINITY_DN13080_c0_g2_i2.p1 TRINITY_DN13080_c0_g2~~TRINITY_DN13080_c0_g2_i2.p1  ORF type:complete len:202 (+),score=17.61 TRINITY_DN13080_c0_g2_i2:75-680(+)